MRTLGAVLMLLAIAAATAAAETARPYAGQQTRAIKAISPDEIDGLLAGNGLGYAKAAELNGYPGPRHVLDLAADLGLEPDQRLAIQAVFDAMNADARRMGASILAGEEALEDAFRRGHAEAGAVARTTAEIAALEGSLRARHLRAHLDTWPLLAADQRARYAQLRGYADPATDADQPTPPHAPRHPGGRH